MSRWYLDTSAALKLLISEPDSSALATELDAQQPELVAGLLLETELRRAAHRTVELTQAMVTDLLLSVSLYEMPVSLFQEAGLLPGTSLRSLDALHLVTAIRIGVDAVVTYDARMIASADELGLTVIRPC